MDLRFISSCAVLVVELKTPDRIIGSVGQTCAHNPLAVFADTNAVTGFLELEVLQQFNTISVLWIILQAALPAACKPFREWPSTVRA